MELGSRHRHSFRVPTTRVLLLPFAAAVAAMCLGAQEPSAPRPVPDAHDHSHDHARGPFRLLDVSLDILAAFGTSTERDAVLGELKGGAHDPRKRGFTLQQAELNLSGTCEDWFDAKAALITSLDPDEGETIVELEEAYVETRQLPAHLHLRVGTFFTPFGRHNPLHPHEWDWLDQPVVHSRVFGADGMRGPGALLSWEPELLSGSHVVLAAQNANGETMASFLANEEVYAERPVGGRAFAAREVRSAADVVYTARIAGAFALSDTATLGLGASASTGPNATGGGADTLISGVDAACDLWSAPGARTTPWLRVKGEFLWRNFEAADQIDASNVGSPVVVPGDTLGDHGCYVQALCRVAPGWFGGLRGEWAAGSGRNYDAQLQQPVDRRSDPFRSDRVRLSPMLLWQASAGSRIRLQYDYDRSDHLGQEAHSVWLGFDVLLGSHPAHDD